jgi:hypothetical protein
MIAFTLHRLVGSICLFSSTVGGKCDGEKAKLSLAQQSNQEKRLTFKLKGLVVVCKQLVFPTMHYYVCIKKHKTPTIPFLLHSALLCCYWL